MRDNIGLRSAVFAACMEGSDIDKAINTVADKFGVPEDEVKMSLGINKNDNLNQALTFIRNSSDVKLNELPKIANRFNVDISQLISAYYADNSFAVPNKSVDNTGYIMDALAEQFDIYDKMGVNQKFTDWVLSQKSIEPSIKEFISHVPDKFRKLLDDGKFSNTSDKKFSDGEREVEVKDDMNPKVVSIDDKVLTLINSLMKEGGMDFKKAVNIVTSSYQLDIPTLVTAFERKYPDIVVDASFAGTDYDKDPYVIYVNSVSSKFPNLGKQSKEIISFMVNPVNKDIRTEGKTAWKEYSEMPADKTFIQFIESNNTKFPKLINVSSDVLKIFGSMEFDDIEKEGIKALDEYNRLGKNYASPSEAPIKSQNFSAGNVGSVDFYSMYLN